MFRRGFTIVFLFFVATAEAAALSLPFVANQGQADARVAFTLETFAGTVFVGRQGEIVYALQRDSGALVLKEELVGAGPVVLRGAGRGDTRLGFFRGRDPGGWQDEVATFRSVALGEPWPGIAVELRSGERNLEKVFHLAAGADPARIALRLHGGGGGRLAVEEDGTLLFDSGRGELRFRRPIAWQGEGPARRAVEVAYRLDGDRYGFTLGSYDPGQALTIDPDLVYSTHLGGSADDRTVASLADAAGNLYLTGITVSPDFPLAVPFDASFAPPNDVFVAKLSSDGSRLEFATYLGGNSFDDGRALALDPLGNLWLTGVTFSSDFPVANGSGAYKGDGDAYVARFDGYGSLSFARYLGGSGRDQGKSIAVDGAGNVVLLGGTASTAATFQLSAALQIGYGGGASDAFLVRFKATNPNQLTFSSFLGGPGDDCAFFLNCTLALDPSGDAVVAMDTTSASGLPTPRAVTTPFIGTIFHSGGGNGFGGDVWLGRIRFSSPQVIYGSYVGGSDWDEPFALAIDSAGGVWLTGDTNSGDFPVLNPLSGPGGYNGGLRHPGFESFLMRFSLPGGASPLSVQFSTYLGGNGNDHAGDVLPAAGGDAWVAMSTTSTNLPVPGALQPALRGGADAYFARLNWNGTSLSLPFATYLGGSADESVAAVALAPGGDLLYAGTTSSIDFPIAQPLQATAVGGSDAFVGRLTAGSAPAVVFSENGDELSPQGTLRVLLVFAEVNYAACPGAEPAVPLGNWPAGAIPNDAATYFDPYLAPGAQPQGYLTKYYWQGSLGQFLVLGDYLPTIVTVPCTQLGGWYGTTAVINQLHAGPPLKTKNVNPATGLPFGLDDFDSWGNQGAGLPKSNFANGVIDALLVVWRNNSKWCGACGLGLQSLYSGQPLQQKKVRLAASYNGFGSGGAGYSVTISEFFHALFGGNHWHTGSGAGVHTFPFLGVGSYSTTQGQVSNTMAGYDRYHMGWKSAYKTELLSALDPAGQEAASDLGIQSHPFGATFVLRDYYRTGDAVRIKLPHFDWQQNGDRKNQYLWLENHQRELFFDSGKWEDAMGKEPWSQGLYVQLQVGKDQKSGASLYSSWPASAPNSLASWLLQYTAEGNYDFLYRFDQAQAPSWASCNWQNPNIPIDKAQSLPNSFTGFSDVYQYIDSFDALPSLPSAATLRPYSDGILLSNDGVQPRLSEIVGNTLVANCNGFGDSQDAFNSTHSANLALGIGTNPAAVPAYTLSSAYSFGGPQGQVASFENRKIRLNNLAIKIDGENVDGQGALRLRIDWDQPRIESDVRWTGDIDLANDLLDPLGRPTRIELAAGRRICLDRGFSATKDYANSADHLFTDPTRLTLHAGTEAHLESGAQLAARNGSQWSFEPGAALRLDAGATFAYSSQPAADLYSSCDQPGCTPAPAGMVAWWSFDEKTGSTALDRAGNHHGTLLNGPLPVPGKVDGALRFPFDQDPPRSVAVADAADLDFGSGSFSFDAWIRPEGPGTVLSKHDAAQKGYEIFIDLITGPLSVPRPVGLRINGNFLYPGCELLLQQWTHLALVVDRGSAKEIRCYLNGQFDDSTPLPAGGSTDNNLALSIGRAAAAGGPQPFTGELDEIELFGKALSPAAIADIFAAGAGGKCRDGCVPPPAGLDAWWPFDEPAPATTAFAVVSGANGAISGATPVAQGAVAGALSFDGVDDFVEAPNGGALDVALGDFTVDLWVRTLVAGSRDVAVLLDKREEAAGPVKGWSLYLLGGRPGVQLADGAGGSGTCSAASSSACTNFGATVSIADGAWHHLAVSVDRDQATGGALLVDGIRVLTFDPRVRSGSLSNGRPLRFGKRSSSDTGYFRGELDEVEIFHRALADGEIAALATAGGKCKAKVDVPGWLTLCPADGAIEVPVTVCNDRPMARAFLYSLHGLPGGDSGCGLPGPTGFQYLDGNPVTVPALGCSTVRVRITRPAGLSAAKTSCYEAAIWETESGARQRDVGVLRGNSPFFCPSVVDPHLPELGPSEIFSSTFRIANLTRGQRIFRWRIEGLPAGAIQLGDGRPGQDLRGEVRAAAGETPRIDFRLAAPGLAAGAVGEYRIHVDAEGAAPDGEPEIAGSVRSAPRPRQAAQPSDLAVEVKGRSPLLAGQVMPFEILLRNAGRGALVGRAELSVTADPGITLLEAGGPGFQCAPATAAGLICTAEVATLRPGGARSLQLTARIDFRPEPLRAICAKAAVPDEVNRDNNRVCLSQDLALGELRADLGDAPDSSNHIGSPQPDHQHSPAPPPGTPAPPPDLPNLLHHSHFNSAMAAYGGATLGNFPTVYDPELGEIPGPIHWQPEAVAWLGSRVSGETEADLGLDTDGVANLDPPSDQADRDLADDGLVAASLQLPECLSGTFEVVATAKATRPDWRLNAFFDFNRDGDWNDTLTCTSRGRVVTVREWAVQNQPVNLVAGRNTLRAKGFVATRAPSPASRMWMRVTLAEAPAPEPGDGRGPAAGYAYGETEDYLLPLAAPSVATPAAATPRN